MDHLPHAATLMYCEYTMARRTRIELGCMQNLKTTMVHMKTTGAHHRDVVFRKNRTVGLYSAGKLLVMLALFAVQPILLHSWFSKSY